MAKLSARGRTELVRVKKQFTYTSSLDGEEVTYTEKRALMSDYTILSTTGGGWKVRGKLKKNVKPEMWRDKMLESGWEVTTR